MGQGQAEAALQLLAECAQSGAQAVLSPSHPPLPSLGFLFAASRPVSDAATQHGKPASSMRPCAPRPAAQQTPPCPPMPRRPLAGAQEPPPGGRLAAPAGESSPCLGTPRCAPPGLRLWVASGREALTCASVRSLGGQGSRRSLGGGGGPDRQGGGEGAVSRCCCPPADCRRRPPRLPSGAHQRAARRVPNRAAGSLLQGLLRVARVLPPFAPACMQTSQPGSQPLRAFLPALPAYPANMPWQPATNPPPRPPPSACPGGL